MKRDNETLMGLASESLGEPLPVVCTDGTVLSARVFRNPSAQARLVVSHGNGLAAFGYRVFWDALRDKFELVVFDMRGHGASEQGGADMHRWDQFVHDLQSLCDTMAVAPDARPLVGVFHSQSAVTSLLHLHRHRERSPWHALVLFDPPLPPPVGHPLEPLHRAEMTALAAGALRRRLRYPSPAHRAHQFLRTDVFGAWHGDAAHDMARATLRPDGASAWELSCDPLREAFIYGTNTHAEVWDVLAEPPCPIRLIAADPARPGAQAPALVSLHAHEAIGVGYESIVGTGHFLQLEQPQRCRDAVVAFLDRLPSEAGTTLVNFGDKDMQADIVTAAPAQGLTRNIVDYLFERRMAPDEARRPYLVSAQATHSFGDLHERVCQVGHLLRSLGVKPGDRVMFSVLDGIDFPALFLGAMKIGAVSLPINTFLTSKDYAYYVRDSGAKVLVVDESLMPRIDAIRDADDFPSLLFVANGSAAGYRCLDTELASQPRSLEGLPRRPDEPAFWLYSSGSTGDPKGVVHTHEHIYASCELFGLGKLGLDLRRDDEILCPPKMFFAYGLGNQVYFPLRAGARVFAEPAPIKPAALLERLIANRPTALMAVPTLFAGLLDLMRSMEKEAIRAACSRLRLCVSGGELLPPAVYRQWLEVTGTEILDGVGTTELTHMFILNRPGAVVLGSCGKLIPGYEARFLDEDGKDVPEGEIGNLFIKGPSAASHYWNKPQKTTATMWGGGVLTGDKCYRDAQGNFFYVGRIDDMLRVGGVWVSPGEIEAALAEHPAVLECAVIGLPDEHEMIKPAAFVIVRQGYEGDDALRDSLRTHLRGKLAHIKCPRLIEFVAELPRTATGKIQRFRLRAAQGH